MKLAIDILGSFALAAILLVELMVLTFLGTIAQVDMSLYDVQETYFKSYFVEVGFLSMPGGVTLLGLLALNLLVGGFIRMRRTRSRVGIFVIHAGVALLLAGGLVEYGTSRKGQVTLYEGQSAAEFSSYFEWEVAITESLPDGRERVYTIPHEQFAEPGKKARFHAAGLPFAVHLAGFLRNCEPARATAGGGVDGFVFKLHPDEIQAERNIAGVGVALVEPNGRRHQGLLWGIQRAPFVAKIGGKMWAVDLRKRSWPLPFSITLKKFTRDLHPGTGMASRFASDITRLEDHVAQDVHISMNEPMRHGGYTFYQSGWGPQNAGPNTRLFSTFSVVENPADAIPWFAFYVIAVGLLLHFILKLVNYLKAGAGRRKA